MGGLLVITMIPNKKVPLKVKLWAFLLLPFSLWLNIILQRASQRHTFLCWYVSVNIFVHGHLWPWKDVRYQEVIHNCNTNHILTIRKRRKKNNFKLPNWKSFDEGLWHESWLTIIVVVICCRIREAAKFWPCWQNTSGWPSTPGCFAKVRSPLIF